MALTDAEITNIANFQLDIVTELPGDVATNWDEQKEGQDAFRGFALSLDRLDPITTLNTAIDMVMTSPNYRRGLGLGYGELLFEMPETARRGAHVLYEAQRHILSQN